ncbi:MAG: hypothetical protein KF861_09965 [Planctomycetaceae bacterium]|nr:hypothetical protein [Planctomycetaceae bacterium]
MRWCERIYGFLMAVCMVTAGHADPPTASRDHENFAREHLVAWCIVPFDALRRGPAERAEMVARLGMRRVAYDWRAEHVPLFEEEILQYQKHGLEFFAFWSWHEDLAPLILKYGVKPQIWITCPSPAAATQDERVSAAAQELAPLARRAAELGLSLGLYNHGGWGGEPRNLIAVCDALRRDHDGAHVGIVYNFHHGHDHIEDFQESLTLLQPYLLCLNLNGMADPEVVSRGRDKILPIGTGRHERKMMRIVLQSGYKGPIGILDHRPEIDAEQSLRENLQGLEQVLREVDASPDN